MIEIGCKHSTCRVRLLIACVACALFLWGVTPAFAEKPEGSTTVHLSGLVPKLIPDAHVEVHLIGSQSREPEHSLAVNQFPISCRPGRSIGLYLDFEDEKPKRILSVAVGPKIDSSRPITIALNRPKLETLVGHLFLSEFAVRHRVLAGDKVLYATLPKWNRASDSIVAASDPTITIRRSDRDGPVVYSGKMEQGGICTGFEWHMIPPLPESLADGTQLHIEVTHDTGDLFGHLKDTHMFRYKKSVDSRALAPRND